MKSTKIKVRFFPISVSCLNIKVQRSILIVVFIFLAKFAWGVSNQTLIQQFNKKQHLSVLNSLSYEDYKQLSSVQLFLLYKVLLSIKDIPKAVNVLQRLENISSWPLAPVLLYEKIKLYLTQGDKTRFLEFIIESVNQFDDPFLKRKIRQILADQFKNYDNKDLLKRSLLSLFAVDTSFAKEPKMIRLLLGTLSSSDPLRQEMIVNLWVNEDVKESLSGFRKEILFIRKNVSKYDHQILEHFKKQFQLNNFEYIKAEIPTFLILKEARNSSINSFQPLKQIYFQAMLKKRQYSKLIKILDSVEGRNYFSFNKEQALALQHQFWIKKGEIKQALHKIVQLKELGELVELNDVYMRMADYYYRKGNYAKSLEFFSQIGLNNLSVDKMPEIKWKLLMIHFLLDNQKELSSIFKWAEEYSFKNGAVAAKFCYWGHKLKLYKKRDAATCYQRYPLTYYGLSTLNLREKTAGFSKTLFASRKKLKAEQLSSQDLQFLELLSLFYAIKEEEVADFFSKRYLDKRKDMSLFISMAEILTQAERYHLLYTLVNDHYSQILQNINPDSLTLLRYFYPSAYLSQVVNHTEKKRIPALLIFAVMREESSFRPEVESKAGAIGLMQLMPKTAKYIGRTIRRKVKTEMLYKPEFNLQLGITYLDRLLKRYKGNLYHTLAAYNGGPTNVRRWQNQGWQDNDMFVEMITFNETKNFIKRVLRSYYVYQELYGKNL